jgi:hypothetical protein
LDWIGSGGIRIWIRVQAWIGFPALPMLPYRGISAQLRNVMLAQLFTR